MLPMKIKSLCITLLYTLFFLPLIGSAVKKNLKTSVVIPCNYEHSRHLYALLKKYQEQTVQPDEVIISISECQKVNPDILEALENEPWMFHVSIIKSDKVQYAGENRNIGCGHATGDIFILQDGDDIPHPQRIEIIKYFFENYTVDHLMHQFFIIDTPKSTINFKKITDLLQISIDWSEDFNKVWESGSFTNGNVAISKEVFSSIQWPPQPRGQDTEFNKQIYSRFKHLLKINAALLCYRTFLSSANQNSKGEK